MGLKGFIEAIERRATDAGVDALALLTTTAARFFARRRWTAVSPDGLPAGVRHSGEFRSPCPASATVMAKLLEHPNL